MNLNWSRSQVRDYRKFAEWCDRTTTSTLRRVIAIYDGGDSKVVEFDGGPHCARILAGYLRQVLNLGVRPSRRLLYERVGPLASTEKGRSVAASANFSPAFNGFLAESYAAWPLHFPKLARRELSVFDFGAAFSILDKLAAQAKSLVGRLSSVAQSRKPKKLNGNNEMPW